MEIFNKLTFTILLACFLALCTEKATAQGCTGITFSIEHYEPCKFQAKYANTTDCFIEIRYILESGSFATWNVNSAAGFTVEVISPSELWIHHNQGFLPLGNQTPLLFTLQPGLNTTMQVAYLDDCAQLGCELIGGIPIVSCTDPGDASISGVKYRECGNLPYNNQPLESGWTIQLLDEAGNLLGEQVTDADGAYAFYDLPYGQYYVKELAQPGWTPKVPATGEYVVNLAPSQQVVRNFGNCYTNGSISGTVYVECDALPLNNQPTLENWTVYLLNPDQIVLDSTVTGSVGAYSFADLPYGWYYIKISVPGGGWTANIPASGQYLVNLAPSGAETRNFGLCPVCDCSTAYAAMEPVGSNGDTCNYILNLDSPNNYCMDHIDVSVSGGYFADIEALADGLEIEILDSTLFRISCCCPCPYIIKEALVAIGGSSLEILVKTFIPSDTGLITCQQVLTGTCPLPAAGSCCPSGMTQGPNYLFYNDDFDLGYTFISESTLVPAGSVIPTGCFTLGNSADAALAHPQWSCVDHTTGSSNGLFAMFNDSYLASNHSLYRTGIYVPPGTWEFSVYVNNLTRPIYNLDDPIVELWVDGTYLSSYTISEAPDGWQKVCAIWENTTLHTINVEVRLGSVSQNGNDIAIDDVSFVQCVPPPPPCQTNVIVTPLNNCGLVQVSANSTGAQPIAYQWCDGSVSGTQTIQLPCGSTTFCVTATCADGTTSTFSIPYNVTDPVPPVAVCSPGLGVDLDANCEFHITPALVDGGSTDDCQIVNMSVSPTVLTGCGVSTVTLTVTDWCNNTSTCTMEIQTIEVNPPLLICPPHTTVNGAIGPNGLCEAMYVPVQPLAIDNCSAAVGLTYTAPNPLQEGTNTVVWTASDDCGNTASCIVEVTVECDTCYCGVFSPIVAYSTPGASGTAFNCGEAYDLPCPPPGQSLVFTGSFVCLGNACPAGTPVTWALTQPSGTVITGTVTAAPYFSVPISPLLYAQAGVYTLVFNGSCGGTDCPPCVIQFGMNCPDPCPCNVPLFQAQVNQGFATILGSGSCKACFTPLALNDCDVVDWSINSGPIAGTTTGAQTFCYNFPGAGTYTVTMKVTRYKSDGSLCEVFVWQKLVTVNCLIKTACDASLFPNSGFSEGAISGGINSSGAVSGWYGACGEPILTEGFPGSHDAWSIEISGNLDSADVLAPLEPVCLEKETGLLSLRFFKGIKENGIKSALHIELYQGSDFEMNDCNGSDCYELAVIDLTPLDSGWVDLEMPYDLNNWIDADTSCGGISARVAMYVTTDIGSGQGGSNTRAGILIDNFCMSAYCSVAFTNCPTSTVIIVDCDDSGDEPLVYPPVNGTQNGLCDGGFVLVQIMGPTLPAVAPNGTYLVGYQLQGLDANLNIITTKNCFFQVSIIPDAGTPVFAYCPPDLTIQGTEDANGVCSGIANWTPPLAIDDSECSGNTIFLQSNVLPGAVLPEGSTIVSYTATDPSNNPASAPCTFTVTVDCTVGTQVPGYDYYSIRIFPNPNTGAFILKLPAPATSGMRFRITDLTGRIVQENPAQPGADDQNLDAGSLPDGLYFIQVLNDGKIIGVEKLVKQ